jgi:hypothetical protein
MELKGALKSNGSAIINYQIEVVVLESLSDIGKIPIPNGASHLGDDFPIFIRLDKVAIK